MPLSLLILYSLFMWSIFCNNIPLSPPYSPFRFCYSESSDPLNYLWVFIFLNWITLFLCLCGHHSVCVVWGGCLCLAGWMDLALNTWWTVECQGCITCLNFLLSHKTRMKAESLNRYGEEERKRSRHFNQTKRYYILQLGFHWQAVS